MNKEETLIWDPLLKDLNMPATMDWIFVSFLSPPPNSYVEALTCNINVFGIRKQLWLNEVLREGPWFDGISILIRRDTTVPSLHLFCFCFFFFFPHQVRTKWKGDCLQARRRAFTRNGISWHLHLGLPTSRIVRKLICCLSYPDYGILLWQPRLPNALGKP